MENENIVQPKSYNYAIQMIKLYPYLAAEKKDFLAKLNISYREAGETNDWLRLLKDTGYMNGKQFSSLISDWEEILRIITATQKTTKRNMNL